MTDDERAIRELVRSWMAASQAGDIDTVLSLMADDAVFQVAGQQPFGKAEFAAASRGAPKGTKIEGTNEIVEIEVFGSWAYIRNRIAVTMTPPGGKAMRRSGYTLTILRKAPGGRWLLVRDANTMTADAG